MVTTAQYTTRSLRPERTPRMVAALNGAPVPCHLTPRTDMNDLPTAMSVFLRLNEGKVAVDTMIAVTEAMRDSSAVVMLYTDAKASVDARCIWPESVTLTSGYAITCHGYCSLRRQFRTFRLDRMITCHALTTPDDHEEPETPAPYYATEQGALDHMQAQEVARAKAEGRSPRAMND